MWLSRGAFRVASGVAHRETNPFMEEVMSRLTHLRRCALFLALTLLFPWTVFAAGHIETVVVNGVTADVLEADVQAMEERHRSGALIFTQAGTYAPTLGVLGAVVGLIAALGNLNDIDKLGQSIAAAFVATLFGIFSGYVLWHPFANKLKIMSKKEAEIKRMIIEGVLSLQAGDSPIAVEAKLLVFVSQNERASIKPSKSEA